MRTAFKTIRVPQRKPKLASQRIPKGLFVRWFPIDNKLRDTSLWDQAVADALDHTVQWKLLLRSRDLIPADPSWPCPQIPYCPIPGFVWKDSIYRTGPSISLPPHGWKISVPLAGLPFAHTASFVCQPRKDRRPNSMAAGQHFAIFRPLSLDASHIKEAMLRAVDFKQRSDLTQGYPESGRDPWGEFPLDFLCPKHLCRTSRTLCVIRDCLLDRCARADPLGRLPVGQSCSSHVLVRTWMQSQVNAGESFHMAGPLDAVLLSDAAHRALERTDRADKAAKQASVSAGSRPKGTLVKLSRRLHQKTKLEHTGALLPLCPVGQSGDIPCKRLSTKTKVEFGKPYPPCLFRSDLVGSGKGVVSTSRYPATDHTFRNYLDEQPSREVSDSCALQLKGGADDFLDDDRFEHDDHSIDGEGAGSAGSSLGSDFYFPDISHRAVAGSPVGSADSTVNCRCCGICLLDPFAREENRGSALLRLHIYQVSSDLADSHSPPSCPYFTPTPEQKWGGCQAADDRPTPSFWSLVPFAVGLSTGTAWSLARDATLLLITFARATWSLLSS